MKNLTLLVPTVVEATKEAMRDAREHPLRKERIPITEFQRRRKGIKNQGNLARRTLNKITRNMKRTEDIRRHQRRLAAVNVRADLNRGLYNNQKDKEDAEKLIAHLNRKPTHEMSNAPKMTGLSRKAAHLGAKEDDHATRLLDCKGKATKREDEKLVLPCPPFRVKSKYLRSQP